MYLLFFSKDHAVIKDNVIEEVDVQVSSTQKINVEKKIYKQKFRSSWIHDNRFKSWIMEVNNNKFLAKCRFCNIIIKAKASVLEQHFNSDGHKTASEPFSDSRNNQTCLSKNYFNKNIKFKAHKAEARLALFIVAHTAFRSIDHLQDICKLEFKDSEHSNLKIHRTKCCGIILNILAPYFEKILREDIGDNKFSLLVDESTDVSVNKVLGVAIRYFSFDSKDIVSTYLGLIELKKCDAQGISTGIKAVMDENKLKFLNLHGLGTDNASVMVGSVGGVAEILKEDCPNLRLVRCVNHSLQLAVSDATRYTIPSHVEFIMEETYAWFSRSSDRQNAYADLFRSITGEKENPLKMVRSCKTRWLSIEPAVSRILDQWPILKAHFNITRRSLQCHKAELLYQLFSNDWNLCYLLFLSPILQQVQRVNLSFQSNCAEPLQLFQDLTLLIEQLSVKVLKPNHKINPMTSSIKMHVNYNSYLVMVLRPNLWK